jgi:plastocyanin
MKIRTVVSLIVATAGLTACSNQCGCRPQCGPRCAPPPCSPCGAPRGGGYAMPYQGAPSGGYAQPQGGYAQPPGGYAQPQGGYGQPQGGYAQPQGGYGRPQGQPQGGYQPTPGSGYGQPSQPGTAAPQGGPGAAPAGAESNVVTVQNHQYNPPTLTVRAGTTVRWVNRDSVAHTATGDGFDVALPPGGEGSFTFSTAGTFEVRCRNHPNMHAQVIVQ